MDRRTFLHTSSVAAFGGAALSVVGVPSPSAPPVRVGGSVSAEDVLSQRHPFTLPALGYAQDAVEPAVDAMTMGLHHDRHHAAYVANLNTAVAAQPSLQGATLRELLTGLGNLPEGVRAAVRNNGGGHANHALYWTILAPGGDAQPTGELGRAIMRDFGSIAACIAALKAAGLGQFESGWAWMVRDGGGKLTVRASANQDTPLSEGLRPVVGIDVWEHAYYLKYQNRRADYLDAVLGRINWSAAAATYQVTP